MFDTTDFGREITKSESICVLFRLEKCAYNRSRGVVAGLSVELVTDLADKKYLKQVSIFYSPLTFLIFTEDKMRFGIAKNENLVFFLPLLSPFAIFVTRR